MPDPQNPNDPGWDWLYQESDPTAAGGGNPDHTAMLPQSPRPEPTPASGVPAPDPAAPPMTSFGGVYPRSGAAGQPAAPAPVWQQSGSQGRGPAWAPAGSPAPESFTRPIPTSGAVGPGVPIGPVGPAAPAGPPPAPARSPRRRRLRVRWLRIIIAVLVAWLLFLVVVPVYAWSKVSKVDATPSGSRPAGGPGTTYLLVGSDSREGLTPGQKHDLGTGSATGQRTDTIILLHVSDSSGPNVMLSIPRDSYVDIPGHGMNKINAAYAFGGPKLLVQTVEHSTGIRVDDYVEIGFTGVVDVVDAVGGITVCPKTAIHDPKAGNLTMQRGCQEVNGHVALDYSRSRAFPLGDITRTQHQREVIAATGSAAASWHTIALPWRYWKVNMAGADSVTVGDNVGPFGFAKFAWAMAHSSGPGTLRCVVPFASLGTSTSVGSVVTWDRPKANAIFRNLENDETSAINCSAT